MTEDERQVWVELRRNLLAAAKAIEIFLVRNKVADGKVIVYNLEDDKRDGSVSVAGIEVAE